MFFKTSDECKDIRNGLKIVRIEKSSHFSLVYASPHRHILTGGGGFFRHAWKRSWLDYRNAWNHERSEQYHKALGRETTQEGLFSPPKKCNNIAAASEFMWKVCIDYRYIASAQGKSSPSACLNMESGDQALGNWIGHPLLKYGASSPQKPRDYLS